MSDRVVSGGSSQVGSGLVQSNQVRSSVGWFRSDRVGSGQVESGQVGFGRVGSGRVGSGRRPVAVTTVRSPHLTRAGHDPAPAAEPVCFSCEIRRRRTVKVIPEGLMAHNIEHDITFMGLWRRPEPAGRHRLAYILVPDVYPGNNRSLPGGRYEWQVYRLIRFRKWPWSDTIFM